MNRRMKSGMERRMERRTEGRDAVKYYLELNGVRLEYNPPAMPFEYRTGGREKYFRALDVRDCVTRAVAIANDMDYKAAYHLVWSYEGESPRNGVQEETTNRCLADLGWTYHDVKSQLIGLSKFAFTDGVVVCRIKNHVTTVIDGVVCDTWNCSVGDPPLVGYWVKE